MILLLVSLVMLCGCLVGLVRLLNSLLGDRVKTIISDHVNKAGVNNNWQFVSMYLCVTSPYHWFIYILTWGPQKVFWVGKIR